MESKSFILSSAGLKNIVINDNEDFIIILGEQEIKINKIFAEFISPKISQLHQIDPTINYLKLDDVIQSKTLNEQLKTKVNITKNTFLYLEQLFKGNRVEITKKEQFSLQYLSFLLGNEEMFDTVSKLFNELEFSDNKDINNDKILNELEFFDKYSSLSEKSYFSSIIDIVSSRFYSIDPHKLLTFSKSTLFSIISNDNLKLNSEDSLFDIINLIFKENDDSDNVPKLSQFYEEIEFECLSENKFKEFLSIFDINEMTNQIWRKLCQCFYINYNNNNKINNNRYKNQIKEILYKTNSNAFDGIVNYLSKKYCNNEISRKNVVEVTCHKHYGDHVPQNAIIFDDSSKYFESLSKAESWLQYDFKDFKVSPTHYSIKSAPYSKGGSHLISWYIEGSNSGKNDWDIIDFQTNTDVLNNNCAEHAFKINSPTNKYYRYLRLRQNGKNANRGDYFSLSSLEYFGSLMTSE